MRYFSLQAVHEIHLTTTQIAQDDDGNFEIRSIAGLSDEDDDPSKDDEEAQRYARLEERAAPPSGGAATSISATLPGPSRHLESQTKAAPPSRPRESLDGETMFAVGEDGEWSDGEEEGDDEGRKLTTKI